MNSYLGKQTRRRGAVEAPENLLFTETKSDMLDCIKLLKEKIDDENSSVGGRVCVMFSWLRL